MKAWAMSEVADRKVSLWAKRPPRNIAPTRGSMTEPPPAVEPGLARSPPVFAPYWAAILLSNAEPAPLIDAPMRNGARLSFEKTPTKLRPRFCAKLPMVRRPSSAKASQGRKRERSPPLGGRRDGGSDVCADRGAARIRPKSKRTPVSLIIQPPLRRDDSPQDNSAPA